MGSPGRREIGHGKLAWRALHPLLPEKADFPYTLRIVSDQVSETLDRDGKPVAGADAVAEITDIWPFERMLGQPDPAWRLSAARSG